MARPQRLICLITVLLAVGCGSVSDSQKRGEKTRRTVAHATARMKPEIQWTARKADEAAGWVFDELVAAGEGFFQGWTESQSESINLNSASSRDLARLPGITHEDARRIVRSRPYRDKRALVVEGIISESAYRRIKDRVTTN